MKTDADVRDVEGRCWRAALKGLERALREANPVAHAPGPFARGVAEQTDGDSAMKRRSAQLQRLTN